VGASARGGIRAGCITSALVCSAFESTLQPENRAKATILHTFSDFFSPLLFQIPLPSRLRALSTPFIMSDNVIIPEYVAPLGPMFNRLPVEVTLKIIEQLVLVGPYYKAEVMDKRRFGILNGFASFVKIRNINKTFCAWIMEVFYHNNDFVFKHPKDIVNRDSWCRTALGPCLPPTSLRGFLRRIAIHTCLDDEFRILALHDANNPLGSRTVMRGSINSVQDLFIYSPGARVLRDLTHASRGFGNLDVLHLFLYTNFMAGHDQKTLNIIRQAGFRVRARDSVTIEVLRVRETGPFCPQVADLIEIELGE
jgi:hypothetical protein